MSLDITGLGSIADLAGSIIDRIWPNPEEAAKAKLDLFNAQQAGKLAELQASWDSAKAQLAVDQAEASNSNGFVAGWRPFIGWVCGFAFAYKFVVQPLLVFVFTAAGHPISLPELALSDMMPVLLGMLGLGAMRSYEKVQGVAPPGHG